MDQSRKRLASTLLAASMVCSLAPASFAVEHQGHTDSVKPTGFIDTKGHWAEQAIDRWSGYGVVGGMGDNNFMPNASLTRAQLATILANTLGLKEQGENPFSDVPADAWYRDAVLRCYTAGIMLGSNGMANPTEELDRQQAMTMLARALGVEPLNNADLSTYGDSADVAPWAAGYVAAMVKAGIVNGVGDNLLDPGGTMNRASVMTVLDRAVVQYINEPGEYDLEDQKGLILVASGDVTLKGKTAADLLITPAAEGMQVSFEKARITGEITVQADDVKVAVSRDSKLPEIVAVGGNLVVDKEKPRPSGGGGGGGSYVPPTPPTPSPSPEIEDLTISEAGTVVHAGTYKNITIASAVGDGEVTLDGVTIQGTLDIQGGGSNSIYLRNCTVPNAIKVTKDGGETPRLHLTQTAVSVVEARKPVILEAFDAASKITSVVAAANVEVKGEKTAVDTVTVPDTVTETAVEIKVTDATVDTVAAQGKTAVSGKIDTVVASAAVEVKGEGTAVENIQIPETAAAPVTVTVTKGQVAKVEAKQEVTITSTEAKAVASVVAEAKVTVPSECVGKVEVPATAKTEVEVNVTGSDAVEITVNSDQAVAIKALEAQVTVSTEKETAPIITINDTPVTHIHKWGEWSITKAATCTEAGTRTATCVAEGCTEPPATIEEAIPALGHKWGPWTDTEDGTNHQHVCANDAQHTETKPHTWDGGKITKAPTCTEAGEKTYTCSVCGATKTEVVNALGHDFTIAQHDETYHWMKCSRCDAIDQKTEHSYDKYDCTQAAQCKGCEYVKPAGEHTWDEGTITQAPTCTAEGVKTYTCSVCGVTRTEVVEKVPHNFETEWLHDETGHWHKCANCDATDTKVPHTYDTTDCTKKAICTICQHEKPAGEHAWDEGKITKAPTCTEAGVKTYTCSGCGATKTEAIGAIGHNWGAWTELNAEQHQRICSNDQSHIEKANHNWTRDSEQTTPGMVSYTCTDCGATKTETATPDPDPNPREGIWIDPETGDLMWNPIVEQGAHYNISIDEVESSDNHTSSSTHSYYATGAEVRDGFPILPMIATLDGGTYQITVRGGDAQEVIGTLAKGVVLTNTLEHDNADQIIVAGDRNSYQVRFPASGNYMVYLTGLGSATKPDKVTAWNSFVYSAQQGETGTFAMDPAYRLLSGISSIGVRAYTMNAAENCLTIDRTTEYRQPFVDPSLQDMKVTDISFRNDGAVQWKNNANCTSDQKVDYYVEGYIGYDWISLGRSDSQKVNDQGFVSSKVFYGQTDTITKIKVISKLNGDLCGSVEADLKITPNTVEAVEGTVTPKFNFTLVDENGMIYTVRVSDLPVDAAEIGFAVFYDESGSGIEKVYGNHAVSGSCTFEHVELWPGQYYGVVLFDNVAVNGSTMTFDRTFSTRVVMQEN